MPTYRHFEPTCLAGGASGLYDRCDEFLELAPRVCGTRFRDQLDAPIFRSRTTSPEGFERGTTSELLAFLYILRRLGR